MYYKVVKGVKMCIISNLLMYQEQMTLLSNLASLAKTYSFGRSGLMNLAECVAVVASGM